MTVQSIRDARGKGRGQGRRRGNSTVAMRAQGEGEVRRKRRKKRKENGTWGGIKKQNGEVFFSVLKDPSVRHQSDFAKLKDLTLTTDDVPGIRNSFATRLVCILSPPFYDLFSFRRR